MTTSLTWTFDSPLPLLSCGIDSERIARFEKWSRDASDFLPFVFTAKERAHCRRMRSPARGLCAAFCVKEAFFKAVSYPCHFTDCELLYDDDPRKSRLMISGKTRAAMGKIHPAAKILLPVPGQITAIVYLFGAA